jgi:hypothetical protein
MTQTQTDRRMTCIICSHELMDANNTICRQCSSRLRAGETIHQPRTYMMPNRVDTTVRFRLKNDRVEWAFEDDGYRYAVCSEGALSPTHDRRTTMSHYTARPDSTYRLNAQRESVPVWAVYDWNGMRIVWNLDESEAARQADALNATSTIARPVNHIQTLSGDTCDAWCCRNTPTPAPEDEEEHDPFCICDACMAERETIDPALLAHVGRVLAQHGTPTPAPEETDINAPCPYCGQPNQYCLCDGRDDSEEGYSATPYEPFVPDFPLTDQRARAELIDRASHIVARLRLKSLGIATAALLFLSVTTHSACYQAGTTGEGFPVITCPLEGATYVVDMDGTDGSRGAENDGRWIRIS